MSEMWIHVQNFKLPFNNAFLSQMWNINGFRGKVSGNEMS